MSPEELQARVSAVRSWHHSIDLGQGVRTPGISELALREDQLPSMQAKTVLDIGAWDGYYSFLAERQGASRVVALDHYAWGVDLFARNQYWAECSARQVLPDHDRDLTDFWQPDLPGKAGFDLAREALGSKVEALVGDIATMDLEPLGRFDVVLFLGVLYHLQEPLSVLRRVRQLVREVAVIETEAFTILGLEDRSLLEFYAGGMGAGHDYGNWFVPTLEALHQLCRAAGFSRLETVVGPPVPPSTAGSDLSGDDGQTSPSPGTSKRWWRRGAPAPQPVPPAAPPPSSRHYRATVLAYP